MVGWGVVFAGWAALAATASAICAELAWRWFTQDRLLAAAISGILALPCACVAVICLHIVCLQPSKSHSRRSLMMQYLQMGIFPFLGQLYYWRMRGGKWRDVGVTQTEVLLHILRSSKDTLYGRRFNFHSIGSRHEYRQRHPLVGYTHYEPYISRVYHGESNVLFPHPVLHFATTSGTTGKSKIFPVTKAMLYPSLAYTYFRHLVKTIGPSLKRILGLRYKPGIKYSPQNIAVSALSYKTSPHSVTFVSPPCASQITDEESALYVHALFGLAEKEIYMIDGLMSPLVLSFVKLIERRWRDLCNDIEFGTLSNSLKADAGIRREMEQILSPNPERAAELRAIFQHGFHQDVLKRMWPALQGMSMLSGGGFLNSTQLLLKMYGRGVAVHGITHGASEGLVGVSYPNSDNAFLYTIFPEFGFYEFIPEESCDDKNPETLFLDEVTVGASYEVVLTTPMGLYRYRLGDVITVTGFMEDTRCPVYYFSYRRGQMLNAMHEKTPEDIFYKAVMEAMAGLSGVTINDYTVTESVNVPFLSECEEIFSKQYVLLIELQKDTAEPILTEEQIKQFDVCLCRNHEIYETLREQGSLASMKVIQVKRGSFQKLKKQMTKDTNNIQFKMPRVLRDADMLQLLYTMRIP